MPYKQKPMSFGEGTDKKKNDKNNKKDDKFLKEQNESEVKSTDYLTKTPSIVATDLKKKEYNQTDEEYEKESDKETERINTTPVTTPPLFSDADAHRKTKAKIKKKGAPNMKTGKYKHNF